MELRVRSKKEFYVVMAKTMSQVPFFVFVYSKNSSF